MDLSFWVPSVATAPRSCCSSLMRQSRCVSVPPGLKNVCWKKEPRSGSTKTQNIPHLFTGQGVVLRANPCSLKAQGTPLWVL